METLEAALLEEAPSATDWFFDADDLDVVPSDCPARPFLRDVACHPHRHNRWVHLAARRHVIDLRSARDDPDYPFEYRPAKATVPISFAGQFCCLEGPLAGERIKLLSWQCFVYASVYGWCRRADPRKRRFAITYTTVPKKNGKTPFAATAGLYQLAYPPPNARCDVFSVATKKDQAKIVWKDARRMLGTAPAWAARFRRMHNRIIHGRSESEWEPVGSDSDTQDGLRPELVIMDELHAFKDRALFDIFAQAFGAAFSGLLFIITTAGDNPDGICKIQENRLRTILDAVAAGTYTGTDGDEANFWGCIWTIDDDDAWDDEAAWHKANPSLGTVKSIEEMRKLAHAAQTDEGARRIFLIKQLNQWQETGAERWIGPEAWAKCGPAAEVPSTKYQVPSSKDQVTSGGGHARWCWERLRGRRVWGGLDMALTNDTNSLCFLADDEDDPEEQGVVAAWRSWVPRDDLPERCNRDNVPYDLYAREKWLTLTAGNVSDVNKIEADILQLIEEYELDVAQTGFDPNYSQGAGVRLANDHGLPMLACRQNYGFYTKPINMAERLILRGRFGHGGNPLITRQAMACVLQIGGVGGKMLAQGKSTWRIDGMVAAMMALGLREMEREEGGGTPGLYVG